MNAENLDKPAALAKVAERAARTAQALIVQQRYAEAEVSATTAADAAGDARIELQRMGAGGTISPSAGNAIPLNLLDTPDVRALLAALEQLQPLAMKIDQSRGRVIETKVGPMGLDVAESLGQLVARLALEVRGPSTAVTGGRE